MNRSSGPGIKGIAGTNTKTWPQHRDSVACASLKMKVPNISVFSATMQGGVGLSSILNVEMIGLQPTFMMFANRLINIKTKNLASLKRTAQYVLGGFK